MEKFEAAKLFLKMLTEHTQDFTITYDCSGRDSYYCIRHTETGTRVMLSVTGKVEAYVSDEKVDLNYVDPSTASEMAIIARDTIEKRREAARIAKDNNLVYNITALYV